MSSDADLRPPEPRVRWIDVARALGIILVVFGHVERGLRLAGVLQNPAWAQVDFMIYTFHMPLFFYLSGMNVVQSRTTPGFLRRRAMAIIVPYFVFSVIQGAVQIGLSGQTNGTTSITDLELIFVAPIGPFWFLYVLLIYVVIVAFWKPGAGMLALAIGMLALSPLASGVSGALLIFQTLYFFVFYVAGALFRVPTVPTWVGVLGLGGWAAACLLALSMTVSVYAYYALYMLPAAVAGIVGLIWIAQRVTIGVAPLTHVGRNVIAIYVMHILATAGARIILLRLGIADPSTHLAVGMASGVALPLLALLTLQKLRLARVVGLPAV